MMQKETKTITTLKTMNHELVVKMPISDNKHPQVPAVVVLWGWWGAEERQLQKYAQLYQNINCVTVAGYVAKHVVFVRNMTAMTNFARESAIQVARVVRSIEKNQGSEVPVFIHTFSNGGCYILDRLDQVIRDANPESDNDEDKDIILVRDRLRGELFDSCPAIVSVKHVVTATTSAFRGPTIIKSMVVILMYIIHILGRAFEMLQGKSKSFIEEFEERMINRGGCSHQAYIYSPADTITPVSNVEAIMDKRRRMDGMEIEELKFDNSGHVQHLRKHPDEYAAFVSKFLAKALIEKK